MSEPGIVRFETMGTVVSLRCSATVPADLLRTIFSRWDERFSLYRPDSEASRVARGELALRDASPELRAVYAESLDWRTATDGVFTPHRPDGVIDLSGTVKARAMQDAADALAALGLGDWLLNVGGDIIASGRHEGGVWRSGIVDPTDRGGLLTALDLEPGPVRSTVALATSGTTERGEHVWRRPAPHETPLIQVSVLAQDILTADVAATAILAGGRDTLDDLATRLGLQVLAIDRSGELLATPGMAVPLRVAETTPATT